MIRMSSSRENLYLPFRSVIKEISDLNPDVKLFKVIPEIKIVYTPGQFFMLGRWGDGEAPISVTSTPGLQKHMEFAIRKVGTVTTTLHKLKRSDTLWLRGPYGNGFSTVSAKGKDVIFIAGGIGIVPLRPLINLFLMCKNPPPPFIKGGKGGFSARKIFLLYGSKNPQQMLFEQDLKIWGRKGVETILTVDNAGKNWKGNTGLVIEHIDKIETDFKKACAYVCGPDIMIEKTMKELSLRDMPDKQIITTLEARMKCGMGKCGQCYHGTEYICTNGPVYSYEEIKKRKVYGP